MKRFENAELNAAIDAFLESDKTISASEFGSAAIGVGFVGVVDGFGYGEVSGPGTSVRTAEQGPQIINIGGKNITIAEVGKPSQAFFMEFEGGARQIAMGALQQHVDSTFKFNNEVEISTAKMKGTDWAQLVGVEVELVDTYTDAEKPIVRTRTENGKQVQNSRPSRVYKFTVNADWADEEPAAPAPTGRRNKK